MTPRCTPSLTSSCRQSVKSGSLKLLQLSIFALICVKSFQVVNRRLEKVWTSWESDSEVTSYTYYDWADFTVGRVISSFDGKNRCTFYFWKGFKPEITRQDHLNHRTMLRTYTPLWLSSV